MTQLEVGDVLEHRYRIDRPIARGGMSTVYRCVDLRLGRALAAKVMHDQYSQDAVFIHRFRREARAMAQLTHPNLVNVYDFSAEGDPVYLIMELITGGTLRELTAERGPMPPHAAVAVMRSVLTGLSAVTVKFDLDPKKSLNIMPQENVLIPDITVLEQIKLVSLINKVYNEENIQNLLAKFSLIDQSNQLIQKLSGGQKRRLSLLISSLRPAKLSILDEPTVGMDLDSIDFFWKLLNSRNESTIVVTHDFNQIDRYFSRVLLLKDGKIFRDVSTKSIHNHNQSIAQWYRINNEEG